MSVSSTPDRTVSCGESCSDSSLYKVFRGDKEEHKYCGPLVDRFRADNTNLLGRVWSRTL